MSFKFHSDIPEINTRALIQLSTREWRTATYRRKNGQVAWFAGAEYISPMNVKRYSPLNEAIPALEALDLTVVTLEEALGEVQANVNSEAPDATHGSQDPDPRQPAPHQAQPETPGPTKAGANGKGLPRKPKRKSGNPA